MTNTVSMGQAKNLINYVIDNNNRIQEESGTTPVAISLEASAGIGKTSVVSQVAHERNMGFTKIDLHQMEEAGDLIGFPQVEYECQIARIVKDENGNAKRQVLPGTVWLNSKQMDTMDKGTFRQTGKTRMGYAKPAWVPEYNENGNLVLLDDYVRANPQLLQACMDLILEQKYVSWTLPKKTTIVLTNNPDDGSYNVGSLDNAQRSRFMNFSIAWDRDAWCRWAESANVDGRCINFVMSYADELFNVDEQGNSICNPRSFVMFANTISGIKDWDKPENLEFISMLSKGCFEDEDGRFSKMFASFIRNKMHLLIAPKDMLLGSWDRIKPILQQTLFDQSGYRQDIAALLERRFSNYVLAWLGSEEKTPIAKVKDRIMDFLKMSDTEGVSFFTKDMYYHMIKTITSDHKAQTSKLLYEPRIATEIS